MDTFRRIFFEWKAENWYNKIGEQNKLKGELGNYKKESAERNKVGIKLQKLAAKCKTWKTISLLTFSCSGVYICLPFRSHLRYAWICTRSSGTETSWDSLFFTGNLMWKFSPLFLNLRLEKNRKKKKAKITMSKFTVKLLFNNGDKKTRLWEAHHLFLASSSMRNSMDCAAGS